MSNVLVKDISGQVVSPLGPLREEMLHVIAQRTAEGMTDDWRTNDFYDLLREGLEPLNHMSDIEVVETFKERFYHGPDNEISLMKNWYNSSDVELYENAVALLEVDKMLRAQV